MPLFHHGFTFEEPPLEREIYRRMREVEDCHWWFEGRRAIVRSVIASLKLPATAQILEAGCGTGGNLALLANFGEVTGLEYDHAAATMAHARKIGHVLQGSLADRLPFRDAQFDLVVLLDVLEHLEDDYHALQSLHRHVRPGGYLITTVPAFMFLWGPHDSIHQHKRRYIARELGTCVRSAQFEVRQLTYLNTLLFPAIAAVRLFDRLIGQRNTTNDLAVPKPRINALLRELLGSERHVVRRTALPFGVSLLAVGQKATA